MDSPQHLTIAWAAARALTGFSESCYCAAILPLRRAPDAVWPRDPDLGQLLGT